MELNSQPEWAHDIYEVELPFIIKKEKLSSDDELPEANSQPSQQDESSEEQNVQEQDSVSAVVKKKERTRFNIFQRAELERVFTVSPYLVPRHRQAVAVRLGVKPLAVQSWFKNRRFKWRKEVKRGSNSSPQGFPEGLSTARAYLPALYQTPYVYNSGRISLPQCQGCCTGKPTNESYTSAFYQYTPY